MSLVDELEALAEPADLDGTAGAAADDAAAAKRFKKSAPEAAPAQPAAPALTTTAGLIVVSLPNCKKFARSPRHVSATASGYSLCEV